MTISSLVLAVVDNNDHDLVWFIVGILAIIALAIYIFRSFR